MTNLSSTWFKQQLVGTSVGTALSAYRSFRSLRSIPYRNPEGASCIANGAIAERLIFELSINTKAFLDVGAHIGSVFGSIHRASPETSIFAVEADPEKASKLTNRFPDCTIFNKAVSEKPGTMSFYTSDDQSGYNSLLETKHSASKIEIEVETLDRLLPDQMIEIIKMDIEGAELGALRGAVSLLDRCRPPVMFESADANVNALGYSPELIWDFFDGLSYQIFTPDRVAHTAPSLSRDTFLDAHHYPVRCLDFFAIPSEKRVEYRNKARSALGINVS